MQGQQAKVVETEGKVVITKSGAKPAPASIGVGLAARDKLGTGESSRAVLQMSEKWFARVDEETDVEIMPGALGAKDKNALKLALGGAFIYSREEEGEVKVQTPSATGGLRGTQLMVRVFPSGRTLMQVVEGEVDLANDFGSVKLKAGEAGESVVGQAPHKTAVIETRNLLQWVLYYPAVLQPEELGFTDDEKRTLSASIDAYRAGDLLGALEAYPNAKTGHSQAVDLYRGAVLLATGQVNTAQMAIGESPSDNPGLRALHRMIAAVQFREEPGNFIPVTAGEALAESYYQQSRHNLEAARAAAKRATELLPGSGYTWTRLAELEFSFGRTREALRALEKGLALTPRNAQAHALRGYLLSAENRIPAARESFQQAVELDGGLGNGWLGLGLTKIKQGDLASGTADLQIAATVEPTRSFFYSYHGKALNLEGKDALARKDFDLARQLDPGDPTPWLYSAIEDQQSDRYNEAISELQSSIDRNDNRQVFRSRFLLDQDAAVRSTNLASIYQDDGMTDLAVRAATRAVDNDYTNASAHLFLANSFDALRDPELISLRYQTAWFNELLLSNLLSPVGGGPLSQFVSQQEYSKLLAADGAGGSSTTEWRSGGYFSEQTSLFANYGRLSAGVDFLYHDNEGYRLNNDDLRRELWLQLKYQVSPSDTAYVLGHGRDQSGGDLFQSYSNQSANTGLRFDDRQSPGLLLAGWNHEWAPGLNTLFLGGRLHADQTLALPNTTELLLRYDFFSASPQFGGVNGVFGQPVNISTERAFSIDTAELQQIWKTDRNTLIAGARWQSGPFNTTSQFALETNSPGLRLTVDAVSQQAHVDFERESAYVYDYYAPMHWLTLIGGASWDRLKHPDDFRFPPVNARQDAISRSNGKFGFVVTPSPWVTIRGAYTEALGGVALDEDVRLEPVQFAGFNQSFRTVISESIASSVEAPTYWNKGLSVEGKLPSRTYWAATFNDLRESVQRSVGVLAIDQSNLVSTTFFILPSSTPEDLRYREQVFTAGLNQLVGREFAIGATYRRTDAEFHDVYPLIPLTVTPFADTNSNGVLNEFSLNVVWNSPAGWFARGESHWYEQDLGSLVAGQPSASPVGDNFWQHNLALGRRFDHNRTEVSVGILNLGDRDYHLSPLTYLLELPHNRTYFVRVRFGF